MWQPAFKSVRNSISVSLLARAQGDPEEWPLRTRRTGVGLYLPCPEMYVPRAGEVGLGQSHLPRLAELLSTSRQPSGTPLGDRSGLSSQPFWHGVRGRSARSLVLLESVATFAPSSSPPLLSPLFVI